MFNDQTNRSIYRKQKIITVQDRLVKNKTKKTLTADIRSWILIEYDWHWRRVMAGPKLLSQFSKDDVHCLIDSYSTVVFGDVQF